MFHMESSGSWDKTVRHLQKLQSGSMFDSLDRYGRIGVDALSRYTPRETGLTADSWGYQIAHDRGQVSLSFFNTNRHNGVNIAVILQYGHGTGTGGYVEGRDYINPAIQPIFDTMVEDIWREVTNA